MIDMGDAGSANVPKGRQFTVGTCSQLSLRVIFCYACQVTKIKLYS